jgi:hypothetical protein
MRRIVLCIAVVLALAGAGAAWSAGRGVSSSEPRSLLASFGQYPPIDVTLTPLDRGYLAAWHGGSPGLSLRRLGAAGKPTAEEVQFEAARGDVALAYDSKRHRVLVAYSVYDPTTLDAVGVMTQRIRADGEPLEAARAVPGVERVRALRYDRKSDGFLLAATHGRAAYTSRLDQRGAPDGNPEEALSSLALECALSERALGGHYLLACTSNQAVTARRLTRAGAPLGRQVKLRGQGPDGSVAVGTSPKRWFVALVGTERVLLRTLDASGHRRGGTSFSGNTEEADADIELGTLAYSPRTRAVLVVWAGTIYDRGSDRGGYTAVRTRLVDGSSLKTIGPLHGLSFGGASTRFAALAPASGRGYVLLIDDSDGPGYPEPYLYSLYSQRLVVHR